MITNKRNTVLLLISIFLLSILIRLPNINRPLSKHHEFLTAISLRILKVWEQEGITNCNFQPRMNFKGDANKNINNHASTTGNMKDKEGNFYYISHPPFAYYLSYSFHAILNISPGVVSLQSFNLLLNFISGILIFLILLEITERSRPISYLGYIFYLFSPASLWFQCNTYMSDITVHFFFLTSVYLTILSLKQKIDVKNRSLWLLYLSLFLMCYTSWFGYFYSFVLFLYLFIKRRNENFYLQASILIFIVFSSMLLTFAQYSQISGLDALIEQLKDRYTERGIGINPEHFTGKNNILFHYFNILLNIFINHGIALIAMGVIFILNRNRIRSIHSSIPKEIMIFTLFPVILLNFFLSDYCGHDFTSLYFSLFFSVYCALFIYFAGSRPEMNRKFVLTCSLYVLISIAWYYTENLPGEYSIKGKRYDTGMNIGTSIKQQSEVDLPVIFISELPMGPEVILYAERNIFEAANEQEALNFLRINSYKEGELFIFNNENKLEHHRLRE